MALLAHIVIALSSIGFSIYLLASPSVKKIVASYGLIFSTIGSGTYLAIIDSSNILRVCVSGLLFSAVSIIFVASAHKKLALNSNSNT